MLVLLSTMLVGCAEDVAKDKAVAAVAEPAKPATPAPEPAAAATAPAALPAGLAVAKDRSSVAAVGAKITKSHPLNFSDFSGNIALDGETVSAISVTVKPASVATDSEKLAAHLRDEDFFFVDKFPDATFVSTSVTPGGEGGWHTVKGNFTLRGITKELSFPATITVKPDAVEANAEFAINRKDFGVEYPGKPDDLIQDNVLLKIALVAPR